MKSSLSTIAALSEDVDINKNARPEINPESEDSLALANISSLVLIIALILTSPPNAQVAAMTSMRTNNFKTPRLTNTLESFSMHF